MYYTAVDCQNVNVTFYKQFYVLNIIILNFNKTVQDRDCASSSRLRWSNNHIEIKDSCSESQIAYI